MVKRADLVECLPSILSTARSTFLLAAATLLSSCTQMRPPGETRIEVQPQQEGGARESAPLNVIARATTVLKPLPERLGNGFGEVRILADGSIILAIRANLPPAERGTYVAWLAEDTSSPLQMGTLSNPRGDTVHVLQTESAPTEHRLPQGTATLTVTWEPYDRASHASKPILEGNLTFPPSPL